MGDKTRTFEEWLKLTDSRYPIEHIYSKEDLIRLADHYAAEMRMKTFQMASDSITLEDAVAYNKAIGVNLTHEQIIGLKHFINFQKQTILSLTTNSLGEKSDEK